MTQEQIVILTDAGEKLAKDVLEKNKVFRGLLLSLGGDKEMAVNDACEMGMP